MRNTRVTLKCYTCKKEFKRKKSQVSKHNFCCHRHQRIWLEKNLKSILKEKYKDKQLTLKCKQCGKLIRTTKSRKNRKKFCSKRCKYLYMHENVVKHGGYEFGIGRDNPRWTERVEWTCKGCGKKKKLLPCHATKKKYCSHKCFTKQNRGRNNYSYKKKIVKICRHCNKKFKVSPCFEESKYCSSFCFHIGNSGPNNWNWQNGKSFEPYPLGWTKTFKEQIRYRDHYRCQLCGVSEVECCKRLSVHHIDYDKNNLSTENLVSLCNGCHSKTNYHRKYWQEYFGCQSLIRGGEKIGN